MRFIFGLPFAAAFLALALWFGEAVIPPVTVGSFWWCLLGALCQIAATALMLMVMKARAFGVAYAYIKTEPVIVALLGVLLLALQSVVLGVWLALRDREAFMGSLREWRVSLGAGFLGAAASTAWFIAFSLTAAANLRTLALIEMPVAATFSRRFSGTAMSAHEWLGMLVVIVGLVLLLAAHA